jgi:hypothetical protein
LRRAKTAAAAAPNRISIGGAGTSCPPDDVEVEVDPPEVELDDEVEELVLLDDEVEDEPDEPEDPDEVDDPEEVDEPEDEPEDPLDEPCPWP